MFDKYSCCYAAIQWVIGHSCWFMWSAAHWTTSNKPKCHSSVSFQIHLPGKSDNNTVALYKENRLQSGSLLSCTASKAIGHYWRWARMANNSLIWKCLCLFSYSPCTVYPVRFSVTGPSDAKGDTKTYRATGPYRAIQGPQLLRDWSVGDQGGGATWTGECRLHQIKACQSSARTPSAAEIILFKFQTWLFTCEIKH